MKRLTLNKNNRFNQRDLLALAEKLNEVIDFVNDKFAEAETEEEKEEPEEEKKNAPAKKPATTTKAGNAKR